MTTVLLDARNITDTPSGVGRYAQALIPELARLRPDVRWCVVRHASNRTPIDGVDEWFLDASNDDLRHFGGGWRDLRGVVDETSPDLFHSLFHILPLGLPDTLRVAMTMHDFIWVDHPEMTGRSAVGARVLGAWSARVLRHSLERADGVIHVSGATRERARTLVGKSWRDGQHHVVHHGVTPAYFEPPPAYSAELAPKLGDETIVAVGNAKPYKNLQLLVRAFDVVAAERPDAQLVLVGPSNGMPELAAESRFVERIVQTGPVDDTDLRAIVGGATTFVFPSLLEGFGMPPLEAMALGVPTLVSHLEPMREVCEGGATLIDPHDADALGDALLRLHTDDDAHAEAAERARNYAADFTWERTAKATLDFYASLGLPS
jgi:glycosyltransferase involved in cell wall biosynthesis